MKSVSLAFVWLFAILTTTTALSSENQVSLEEAKRLFSYAEKNYPDLFNGKYAGSNVSTDNYGRIFKFYYDTLNFILVVDDRIVVAGKSFKDGLLNVGNIYNYIDYMPPILIGTPEAKIAELAGNWRINLDGVFANPLFNSYTIQIFERNTDCSRNCLADGKKGNDDLIATYFIPEDTFIIVDMNLGWDENTVISYQFKAVQGDTIIGTVEPSGKKFTATRIK